MAQLLNRLGYNSGIAELKAPVRRRSGRGCIRQGGQVKLEGGQVKLEGFESEGQAVDASMRS
jgi:hypothetical protein